jgi:hypothetical protein
MRKIVEETKKFVNRKRTIYTTVIRKISRGIFIDSQFIGLMTFDSDDLIALVLLIAFSITNTFSIPIPPMSMNGKIEDDSGSLRVIVKSSARIMKSAALI